MSEKNEPKTLKEFLCLIQWKMKGQVDDLFLNDTSIIFIFALHKINLILRFMVSD